MVGYAFTLCYAPAREDVVFGLSYDNKTNVQRLAVEAIEPGDVLMIDARSKTTAASFGHIIATRIQMRGAAGLVTDGALRTAQASRRSTFRRASERPTRPPHRSRTSPST